MYAGFLGASAKERRVWGAECLLRRKGAALGGRLGARQLCPESCLCPTTTPGSSKQQQLQGEFRVNSSSAVTQRENSTSLVSKHFAVEGSACVDACEWLNASRVLS